MIFCSCHTVDLTVLYTSTLSVSSETSPTRSQILPILKKLEMHYTALDPRFKHTVEDSTVWERVKEMMMAGKSTESEQPTEHHCGEDGVMLSEGEKERERE